MKCTDIAEAVEDESGEFAATPRVYYVNNLAYGTGREQEWLSDSWSQRERANCGRS